MAVAAILKIAFLATTRQPIVRFEAERHVNKGYMNKNCKFINSKMVDGRHFVNRKIAISQ